MDAGSPRAELLTPFMARLLQAPPKAGNSIVLVDGKRVKLPFDSIGKDDSGLMLGITADEFKAVIAKAAAPKSGS